jgi:hypothetical protein
LIPTCDPHIFPCDDVCLSSGTTTTCSISCGTHRGASMSAILRLASVAPALRPCTCASASSPRRVSVAKTSRVGTAAVADRDGHGRRVSITSSPRRIRFTKRHRDYSVQTSASNDDTGSLLDDLTVDERCPVPKDQRPSSQLLELQDSLLMGWGGKALNVYAARLGGLGAFFYVTLAYPIASVSYDPTTQPTEAFICACTGSFTAVAVFALLVRIAPRFPNPNTKRLLRLDERTTGNTYGVLATATHGTNALFYL